MMYKDTPKQANLLVWLRHLFRSKINNSSEKAMIKQSFSKRLRPLRWFVSVLIITLLLWSATTESLFLFSGFMNISENWIVALSLTGIFILIIESCKYFLGKYSLRFITHGWLLDGWRYILAFTIVLPLAIAIYYASFFLSVNGAPQIVKFVKTQMTTATFVDIDSIHAHFDTLIVEIELDKANAQNTTWLGVTTQDATILLQKYEDRIATIEQQRSNAIERAELTIKEDKDSNRNDVQFWGLWFARFGGYGEVLTVCFLLFLQVYHRASEEEKRQSKSSLSFRKPINDSSFLTKNEKENVTKNTIYSSTVEENVIIYEGKPYTEARFKDWINKTKFRSENNKTEASRKVNLQRYYSLIEALKVYENAK